MQPKPLETIRTEYLRDVKNQCPAAFTHSDSDNYIRASATASAIEGNYQYGSYILRQLFVTTSDEEYLEIHAANYGIYRKSATAASGEAKFTGETAAVIPVGSQIQLLLEDESSLFFITSAEAVLDAAGEAVAHVVCQTVGTGGNQENNTEAQLVSAPSGVDTAVTLLTMRGGTDREDTEALRDRVLDRLRNPPAGGNVHDYYVWAMSVEGVYKAYVYPLRRGDGTVDVVILGENGLPSQETIEKCQTYIDTVRPVTAKNCAVIAPDVRTVDISILITLSGSVARDIVEQNVIAAIKGYFAAFAPGQDFIKSQLETLVSHVAGVYDRTIIVPADNIKPEADETTVQWLQAGTITVNFA